MEQPAAGDTRFRDSMPGSHLSHAYPELLWACIVSVVAVDSAGARPRSLPKAMSGA